MTIVVLLFLAGIWGVVLYGYFRDRLAEVRPADSIGTFRRQLSVLERTGPVVRTTSQSRPTVDAAISPLAPVNLRAVGPHHPPFPSAAARPARRPVPSTSARRRREILSGLLLAAAGSLVLGFVPVLRVMWALHLVLDLLLVAYVALLIRMRNAKAERDMKLRFLPASAAVTPVSSVSEPVLLLRRTAGN